ncbi:DNA alkylation repair protein [Mesorhizobium sp. B2-5-13]|uniref:DNA alkylation repair protein n=1 Tax=unclassified Mesorhizobium TaxID=325217 RepID=UPI001126EF09|nr:MULTISPECIES: DNA alkylation repair protein [unclassified Mesorhizobium]TPJ93221.1 DNA alkylation repair protein [Mesorhizobium sp. B2-5-13]TPK47095.1 DNA alkylation repair protein [Mesorhizobium sp. B2-5-5]
MAELSPQSSAEEIVAYLRSIASAENRLGMLRYGIKIERALGISHGVQRQIAKKIKRNHERAFALWQTGIVEAQFIASVTADPKRFSAADARQWASSFDSWDIVDGVSDLFVDTDAWIELIREFAADEREFVRRTAFAMMAWSVVHRKKEPEATFLAFLPIIEVQATDARNFVKKGVNWALRSLGKRSMVMHGAALAVAERLAQSTDKTARWIGKDAVKELSDARTIERLAARKT